MNERIKIENRNFLLFLVSVAVLFIGVGYASINSIILDLTGNVNVGVQKNVFITNVEYVSSINANTNNSQILNYIATTMQSTIVLSTTNANSEIIYKVSVYNNSQNTYKFFDVVYAEENYDNPDIICEIQDNGFKIGDTIAPAEQKDIYVKFKYKDSKIATNNILNSYINFKITSEERILWIL